MITYKDMVGIKTKIPHIRLMIAHEWNLED